MTEKEWGFLYLLHSLSLDYVTCFPQLFSLFLALNAHSHLFSEPQSTKTLLLCRISDESTTSSYSYLSADLVNNRQRKCVNLVILLLNKRLSPHIHIYTHTHTQLAHTLLSSMTVLSDSIHIGSMSPSKTIHFGPLWLTLASSRIMLENRPVRRGRSHFGYLIKVIKHWSNTDQTLFLQDCSDHHLSTLWLPGWWCQKARHWSQPLG